MRSSPPVRLRLLERMAELYATSLAKSQEAVAYLAERGITDAETMRAFRLGYVDGSCAKLVANRDHREALTELGRSEREGHGDALRLRGGAADGQGRAGDELFGSAHHAE